MEMKYDPPQIFEKEKKRFALDKVTDTGISYFELHKDGDFWKRTDQKIETTPAQMIKDITEKRAKVIMPSKSFIKDMQFEGNFQAPQLIGRQDKVYGLDKAVKDRLSYYELEKVEGDRYKRTDVRFDTTGSQLASEIREGKIKVMMPSQERIREISEKNLELMAKQVRDKYTKSMTPPGAEDLVKQVFERNPGSTTGHVDPTTAAMLSDFNRAEFDKNFKAPAMIKKQDQTYGLDKHEGSRISYFELVKEGDKLKRTSQKLETSPSELVKQIKAGEVKVLMANKEYVQERESAKSVEKELEPYFEPRELVKGDLVVTKEDQRDFSNIHGVTGMVYIQAGADTKLDNLEHAGAIKIDPDAKLSTPNLVEVNTDLKLDKNSKMYAPYLENVGGKIEIQNGAELQAKSLDQGNSIAPNKTNDNLLDNKFIEANAATPDKLIGKEFLFDDKKYEIYNIRANKNDHSDHKIYARETNKEHTMATETALYYPDLKKIVNDQSKENPKSVNQEQQTEANDNKSLKYIGDINISEKNEVYRVQHDEGVYVSDIYQRGSHQAITHVEGSIVIDKNIHVKWPTLEYAKSITLKEGASLVAENLKKIDYPLELGKDAKLVSPSLNTGSDSDPVKQQVQKLYKEHEDLQKSLEKKTDPKMTVSVYEEKSSSIMREIETIEKKHGVFHKDEYLKAAGMNKENAKNITQTQDVTPIHIEPLTARERKEVKEAMQENKLQDDKHAKHLFEKFDKHLNSVPDNIRGNRLDNHDKLKLLVGDFNDHQNTTYKVENNKTISFLNEKERGSINHLNSQFSKGQIEKMELEKKNSNEKGLRL